MKLESLHKLIIHELKDLDITGKQFGEALPKMSAVANSLRLKQAFDKQLSGTETHIPKIEEIFESFDFAPGGKHCDAAEGLVKEGAAMIGVDAGEQVRDASLICGARRVEHCEFAAYGNAVALAKTLGYGNAAMTL